VPNLSLILVGEWPPNYVL